MDLSAIQTTALAAYLGSQIEGFRGPMEITKFAGGQSNPTFLIHTAQRRYVLRSKPRGELVRSAHAIDREFRVLSALNNSNVPVAYTHLLCENEDIIGTPFYVMDYLDGRVFWDQTLPDLAPSERRTVFDEMNRLLVAIHSVDLDQTGLRDFGRAGNSFERQFHRWSKQYRMAESQRDPEMDHLIGWLECRIPPDDGRLTLIHGDFRLDNIMWDPDQVVPLAVMDWELSTLGHPFLDLAYQCMQWRLPANKIARGFGAIDRVSNGLPLEAEYVATYCSRMNIDAIENWDFYLAFAFFRLAAIVHGIKQRAKSGTAASSHAKEVAALFIPILESALEVIEGS